MKNFQKNWKDLQYPKALEKDKQVSTPFYGKFICEPLEPGYGITLGNALRRVLLSSIQGPAITSVRIEGVKHEFSTIAGVTEDVTEIILNLKNVDLKMHTYEPRRLRLSAEGPSNVKASDILVEESLMVEVVNGEQHIATLAEGAKLDMELTVNMGSGYDPVSRRETEKSIGLIHIDAFFSPVKKVNYTVTNARVGQRTDYQKLTVEIWTNGTILPEQALSYSAKIIKEQLNVFIDFDEQQADDTSDEQPVGIIGYEPQLLMRIEDLQPALSVRSENCLKKAGILYVGEVIQKTDKELLDLGNFGKTSLQEVTTRLEDMGLELGMTIDSETFEREREKQDLERGEDK